MTHEPNTNKMIPLHIADQAVANCEAEIAKLRDELFNLTCKGAAMSGYLDALAKDTDLMPDQGNLQRILLKSVSDWDTAVERAGMRHGR